METGRCIQEAVSCSASCANCGIRPSSPVTWLTGLLGLLAYSFFRSSLALSVV